MLFDIGSLSVEVKKKRKDSLSLSLADIKEINDDSICYIKNSPKMS